MFPLGLPEPPTAATLNDARNHLSTQQDAVRRLTGEIDGAEEELDRIVRTSRLAIEELQRERAAVEEQLMATLAYLAPIRRLPRELLAHIFATRNGHAALSAVWVWSLEVRRVLCLRTLRTGARCL